MKVKHVCKQKYVCCSIIFQYFSVYSVFRTDLNRLIIYVYSFVIMVVEERLDIEKKRLAVKERRLEIEEERWKLEKRQRGVEM